jgi:hypothetical protein
MHRLRGSQPFSSTGMQILERYTTLRLRNFSAAMGHFKEPVHEENSSASILQRLKGTKAPEVRQKLQSGATSNPISQPDQDLRMCTADSCIDGTEKDHN